MATPTKGGGAGVCAVIVVVLALFLTGSMNTILTKVLLTLRTTGAHGTETFKKPFFGTFNMFFAMCLVMAFYYAKSCVSGRKRNPDMSAPMLGAKAALPWWKAWWYIAAPAFFDLLSMSLMLIGMIYIPASVWQMLRGANIIFSAILTIIILRRRLLGFHWAGVGLAILGICCVSVAALQSPSNDSDSEGEGGDGGAAFGVVIVLIAQVIQAAQIILEEQLLTDLSMDPLLIVGVEGVWGVIFMAVGVMPVVYLLPGSDYGHMEDVADTVDQIVMSSSVQGVLFLYMFSCATYNVAGMMVTEALSGVMRVMLEATRTLCIWLFTLVWHYCVDPQSKFGEQWTSWSYLQLLGFVILALGQATYGRKLVWPCLKYPKEPPPMEHYVSPTSIRSGAFSPPPADYKLTEQVG